MSKVIFVVFLVLRAMGGASVTTLRKATLNRYLSMLVIIMNVMATVRLPVRQTNSCKTLFLSLHLLGGLGEVGESLTALELGVLDDTCTCTLALGLGPEDEQNIPASASDEKLAVH